MLGDGSGDRIQLRETSSPGPSPKARFFCRVDPGMAGNEEPGGVLILRPVPCDRREASNSCGASPLSCSPILDVSVHPNFAGADEGVLNIALILSFDSPESSGVKGRPRFGVEVIDGWII